MSWFTPDFPDLQHQGRGLEATETQRGMLCPLGELQRSPQQLNVATTNGVAREKTTPTVDSGASDTVILPHMLAWLETLHTDNVGTECEVAKGEVAHNLGERRCMMRTTEKSKDELEIVFRVVEDVQKPLLAVSSIVRQGIKWSLQLRTLTYS